MATATPSTVGTTEAASNALTVEVLQFFSSFLQEMHEKNVLKDWKEASDVSRFLLDKNIVDTLGKIIHDAVTDPITANYNALTNIETIVRDFIHKVVCLFIEGHADLLGTALYSGDLYYCLVLKEDTLKNRSIFNQFLLNMESEAYFERFPVYFQFIPPDLVEGFQHLSTLDLP